ncbi:MAG: DUF2442 domain-containing protein [Candidatus Hydrogenedentes bacterium]|nr:DUF2442 domain-containing protein [Candidatus Hydrogenedentota bacterium]
MSLSPHGNSTLAVEITNISAHGVWIRARGRELFMSYQDFPWFKRQPVEAIINVVEVSPGHFHWPDIDIDLTEEIIEHPERFPLKANGTAE